MNADVPLDRALAAARSLPSPRTAAECDCAACHEQRARERAAQDWRDLRRNQPQRTATHPDHGKATT